MIFMQFTVGYCCEMYIFRYRYAILVVLVILPLFSSANTVRRRRRPNLEQAKKNEEISIPDQIAEPSKLQQNHLLSTSYSAQKDSGDIRHGKIVVGGGGSGNNKYLESLSDAKTAEEFVHNALRLQTGVQTPIPQRHTIVQNQQTNANDVSKPSYPEYEVYESGTGQTEAPFTYYKTASPTRPSYDLYDYNEQTTSEQSSSPSYSSSLNQYKGYSIPENTGLSTQNSAQNQAISLEFEQNTEQAVAPSTEKYIQEIDSITPKISGYHESSQRPISKSSEFYDYLNQPPYKNQFRSEYYHQQPYPKVTKHKYSNPNDDQIPHSVSKHRYNPADEEANLKIMEQIEESMNNYMKALENERKAEEHRNIQKYRQRPHFSEKPYSNNHHSASNSDPIQEILEDLNDNVEFIYKAKTRPPIPQKLPSQFDHAAVLKNLQDFDTPHSGYNDRPYRKIQPVSPYVKDSHRESNRPAHAEIRLRKTKFNRENPFSGNKTPESRPISEKYQSGLKKFPISVESNWQPINPENIPADNDASYERYNTNFKNHHEGFGYQHTYKLPTETRGYVGNHSGKRHIKPTKRPKRGGHKTPGRNSFKFNKDPETSVALRPPPY